jgi:hypothetical protein
MLSRHVITQIIMLVAFVWAIDINSIFPRALDPTTSDDSNLSSGVG